MAKFYYQGHGSYRITTDKNEVIYVDPYVGDGYDVPADLIIVTHEHHDHNKVELVTKKDDTVIWRASDFVIDGVHQTKEFGSVKIRAVEAYNKNHKVGECFGFVLEADGKKIYGSGDTSTTNDMATVLRDMKPDWAILCTDGVYNMGIEEASRCARLIGAAHTIPIHTGFPEFYYPDHAAKLDCEGRVLVGMGEEITL